MTYRGPLQTYEIVWQSGHIETIRAHQVIYSGISSILFDTKDNKHKVYFHGEINGHWLLVLQALEEDIKTIRLVTNAERVPEE